VRRFYTSFRYQAGSWTRPRRVVAKVEWRPGELYPHLGFIVTNMARAAESVVGFHNKRGTCEQWIKEGKGAINWTRLSCRSFAANAVRLQLHALAYNLGNFLRTLATPEPIKDWSLTTLKEKLIKIGAKVVSHARYVAFQMAEVAIPGDLFADRRERRVQMTGKLAISVVRTSASAGRPPSCAPAAVSVTARPCQRRQIGASLNPNGGPSGESRFPTSLLEQAVATQTLTVKLDTFERIDRMFMQCEARGDRSPSRSSGTASARRHRADRGRQFTEVIPARDAAQ
jgi:hypothetical protein